MTAAPLDEAAVALLRDAIDALDEAAYATVAGEELDDVTAANLRVGIRTAIQAFVDELTDPARASDRALFVAHGRAQYRAGRTLEEMLGFYQLSALTLWRRGADLGLQRGQPAETTAALAEAIMRFVHELSVAAVSGYTEERAAGDRERLARRAQLSTSSSAASRRRPTTSPASPRRRSGCSRPASSRSRWRPSRRCRGAAR